MRRLTDALLAHPGIDEILDVKDAHGDTALSLAVNKGHTYLALRLLEKGASLTPDAGEALGLDNVLTVANVMHSLVLARNVAAIRWLIVRSDSDPKVLLSRDGKGRTPRDLVRLGDAIGHRIHSMLLAAEDAAMGLTDGYVDVGLTRPEDIVEQLQWEKYERAMARHRRRVRARQRARCRARFGCAGCSLCGCGGAGTGKSVVWVAVVAVAGAVQARAFGEIRGCRGCRQQAEGRRRREGAVAQQGGARSRCRRRDGGGQTGGRLSPR